MGNNGFKFLWVLDEVVMIYRIFALFSLVLAILLSNVQPVKADLVRKTITKTKLLEATGIFIPEFGKSFTVDGWRFKSERKLRSRRIAAGDCVRAVGRASAIGDLMATPLIRIKKLRWNDCYDDYLMLSDIVDLNLTSDQNLLTVSPPFGLGYSGLIYGRYSKFFNGAGKRIKPSLIKPGDCLDLVLFKDGDYYSIKKATLSSACYSNYFRSTELVTTVYSENHFSTNKFEDLYYGDYSEVFDLNGVRISPSKLVPGDCVEIVAFRDLNGYYLLKSANLVNQCSMQYFVKNQLVLAKPVLGLLTTTAIDELLYDEHSTFFNHNGDVVSAEQVNVGDCLEVVAFSDRFHSFNVRQATVIDPIYCQTGL